MVERAGDPADGLGSAEPDPAAEWVTTEAIGGESEASGATSLGSPSTWTRGCTGDGPPPAGTGVVSNGITVVGSAEGPHTGLEPGCGGVLTARWRARSGTIDRAGDPADGLGSAEPDPALGAVEGAPAEGITTEAIGGVSDTSGATFSGSASVRRCTGDGSPSVRAGVVGDGVAAIGSAGGGDAESGSGSTGVSIARWRAISGTVDRAGDPADGLGSAEPDAAEGIIAVGGTTGPEGIGDAVADASGGEPDTSGAISIGSIATSVWRCTGV